MARNYTSADGDRSYVASDLSGGAYTMACWFKQPTAANEAFLSHWSGYHRQTINCQSDNTVDWDLFNGSIARATPSNSFTSNAWQHVCGVKVASNDWTCVLNGDWSNRGTYGSTKTFDTPTHFCIGAFRNTSAQFNGDIAEVAVWSAALTQGEVEALADGYSPALIRPVSLLFYAPLIRAVRDRAKVGYTISEGGTPAVADHPPIIYPARPHIVTAPAAAAPAGGAPWLINGGLLGPRLVNGGLVA